MKFASECIWFFPECFIHSRATSCLKQSELSISENIFMVLGKRDASMKVSTYSPGIHAEMQKQCLLLMYFQNLISSFHCD